MLSSNSRAFLKLLIASLSFWSFIKVYPKFAWASANLGFIVIDLLIDTSASVKFPRLINRLPRLLCAIAKSGSIRIASLIDISDSLNLPIIFNVLPSSYKGLKYYKL